MKPQTNLLNFIYFITKKNIFFSNANMPKPVYDIVIKDFNRLLKINSLQGDYSVYLNYVSYVVNLPWNKSTKETLDLEKARKVN